MTSSERKRLEKEILASIKNTMILLSDKEIALFSEWALRYLEKYQKKRIKEYKRGVQRIYF